jgi:mRNA interferase MazF
MTAFQWAVMQANLDPAIGTEQKGIRPVLIISNEDYNQTIPNVTVLPLTSTKRRLYPSEVFLLEAKS